MSWQCYYLDALQQEYMNYVHAKENVLCKNDMSAHRFLRISFFKSFSDTPN